MFQNHWLLERLHRPFDPLVVKVVTRLKRVTKLSICMNHVLVPSRHTLAQFPTGILGSGYMNVGSALVQEHCLVSP